MTGRDWGLEERQLYTVASGYIRGALEHAAAAWLPATSPSHILLLEREMRGAARVITGCPRSTPSHAVMAEAGLAPVAERRLALAARLLAKARTLPEDDPPRTLPEVGTSPPGYHQTRHRSRTTTSGQRRAAKRRCVPAPGGPTAVRYLGVAEMLAPHSALSHLRENPAHVDDPIVVCTDSQSALASLREGPAAQSSRWAPASGGH